MRRLAGAFLAMAGMLLVPAPAPAQDAPMAALTGTLKKIRESGAITLGYRQSSIPFSYLNSQYEPLGYAIDLCQAVVEDVRAELDGRPIAVRYAPMTADDRIAKVASGAVDLECGSTTSNFTRQKQVAFSPVFFVSGTKLLVKRGSGARSIGDLAGKTVVVTAGTTNEAAIRTISQKRGLGIKLTVAPDHDRSFAMLAGGAADAFATDDVLLYGLVATAPQGRDYEVVGDYLSYEPYGLMFRKDDPDFAALVAASFRRLAASRELGQLYDKWFLRRLPTGERLGLPMSPQLEEIFRMLGAPEE